MSIAIGTLCFSYSSLAPREVLWRDEALKIYIAQIKFNLIEYNDRSEYLLKLQLLSRVSKVKFDFTAGDWQKGGIQYAKGFITSD